MKPVKNFFGKFKLRGTFKELMLTIIGTTISIILTFGTSAYFEHRQQEENRRLITMMVIGDLYDFECMLHWTDSLDFNNWQRDMEELQTLSHDSILRLTDEQRQKYWTAISIPISFSRDKTAENLFSSDISIWRDVGNFRFIKVVGRTYSEIADIEKNIKAKMDEKGGLSRIFESNYDTENMSDGEKLIAYMQMKEVKSFMDDYLDGFRQYIQYSVGLLHYNVDQCLKIMGITKEELIDFITNNTK